MISLPIILSIGYNFFSKTIGNLYEKVIVHYSFLHDNDE